MDAGELGELGRGIELVSRGPHDPESAIRGLHEPFQFPYPLSFLGPMRVGMLRKW